MFEWNEFFVVRIAYASIITAQNRCLHGKKLKRKEEKKKPNTNRIL